MITGANRGIGLEFVTQYLAAGQRVLAACRKPESAHELANLRAHHGEQLEIATLDVADHASIKQLAAQLKGRSLGLLINNAGVYGPSGTTLQTLDTDAWLQVFKVNSIAPVQVAAALRRNLEAARSARLVVITSRMGSIADNSSGAAWIYRSSKAAVNAAYASLALDLKDSGIAVAILHPGWVKTDMGGANALIDVATSVAGMRKVIDNLDGSNSGRFLSYDGSKIPW